MTPTATYIAEENCLQELPQMEKPKRPFAGNYSPQESPEFRDDLYHYEANLEIYNAHLATLRKIPCDPSCKGLWEDQQKVVEGKDYGVRDYPIRAMLPTDPKFIAFPLVPVKSEEKTFTLSELKEIIRSRMYTMENGRQPREGCNALFYNLIYFLEYGEEDPNA